MRRDWHSKATDSSFFSRASSGARRRLGSANVFLFHAAFLPLETPTRFWRDVVAFRSSRCAVADCGPCCAHGGRRFETVVTAAVSPGVVEMTVSLAPGGGDRGQVTGNGG